MKPNSYDVIIIGGGFYGCALALYLRKKFRRIAILEKESALLLKASHNNQARIHGGYHYPRSVLTALRSRVNYEQFVSDYSFCLDQKFEKYYAVARFGSSINANHFHIFCERINAPISEAPKSVRQLVNSDLIEEIFKVEECAIDTKVIQTYFDEELRKKEITLWLNTKASQVRQCNGAIEVEISKDNVRLSAGLVFNCTYARLNELLANSSLPLRPLKHEYTEIALIDVPESLKGIGITVMDGPFFSCMPYPADKLHSLSHVRYTPHSHWHENEKWIDNDNSTFIKKYQSNFPSMIKDAQRYIPMLANSSYKRSMWETKTTLPENEKDDGRPILLLKNHGLKNFYCVMGGKLDNIYDIFCAIDGAL